jgi:HD superfamily phosphodiesterase
VTNPAVSLGCAQWCKHAKECLGFDPKSLNAEKRPYDSIADQLIAAVKTEFGADQRRITHALQVLERAEEIMQAEGGEPRVVIAAALLHDIGIQEAERKHGSGAPEYQEAEGPPIARRILEKLGFGEQVIEEVCCIVGSHHTGGEIDTAAFRIIWDADNIVNLVQEAGQWDAEQVEKTIKTIFRTRTGKETFRKALLARAGAKAGQRGNPD